MTGFEMSFGSDYAIVVIGGGSGIGATAAGAFARRGASVCVLDRSADDAAQVAADITEAGGKALHGFADVTDEPSMTAAAESAIAQFGHVDAVVNTAGVQGPLGMPSHEVAVDDFARTLAVNTTGALVVTRAFVPHMLARGYGRIAHVASIAGKEGNPNMVSYAASKGALIALVKTQGKEYATSGITVNAVAPAVIATPFLDNQPQQVLDYMLQKIPMGRPGRMDEVADILTYMVSPACSFITGFTFDLSGGRATY